MSDIFASWSCLFLMRISICNDMANPYLKPEYIFLCPLFSQTFWSFGGGWTLAENIMFFMAGQPTPPTYTPPRNKALLRAY